MATLLEARSRQQDLRRRPVRPATRPIALDDFSLSIDSDQPSITAVVGESGSGKTTLARLLLGLLSADARAGSLRGPGSSDHVPRRQWRAFRRDVQVIFQDPYEVYNPFYRVDHVLDDPGREVPAGLAPRRRPGP